VHYVFYHAGVIEVWFYVKVVRVGLAFDKHMLAVEQSCNWNARAIQHIYHHFDRSHADTWLVVSSSHNSTTAMLSCMALQWLQWPAASRNGSVSTALAPELFCSCHHCCISSPAIWIFCSWSLVVFYHLFGKRPDDRQKAVHCIVTGIMHCENTLHVIAGDSGERRLCTMHKCKIK